MSAERQVHATVIGDAADETDFTGSMRSVKAEEPEIVRAGMPADLGPNVELF